MVPQDAVEQISIGIFRTTGEKVMYFNASFHFSHKSGVTGKVTLYSNTF